MIGYIKGTVTGIFNGMVLIENNGIGYNINISERNISKLSPSSEIKIYTYMSVKEDDISLFGFLTRDELELFKRLITVNGIGPKGAIAILSAFDTDTLRFIILSGDAKSLSKAQGVGLKTAQKVILELKDKIDITGTGETGITQNVSLESPANEAVEALVALGYSNTEAYKAVNSVKDAENMDTDKLLKLALKKISAV